MSRLRAIAALVLLTLWLPATLHCDLEAAGLEAAFFCHSHDDAPAEPHCRDDACHTLEGVALKLPTFSKLVGEIAFAVVALLLSPPALEVPPAQRRPDSAPVELTRSWQFLTRAAPPARAPAVLA